MSSTECHSIVCHIVEVIVIHSNRGPISYRFLDKRQIFCNLGSAKKLGFFRRAGTKNKLGAKQQAPGPRRRRRRGGEVRGGGFPLPIRSPPHPTRGSGERRELPQRGPEHAEPRRKTNLVHSDALRRPLVAKIHKVL